MSFRKTAISWIRERAKEIEDEQDYGFVHFVAHLFAIASLLEVSRGDLEAHGKPESVGSLKDAAKVLASLRSDLDAPALYLRLLDVLLTVQDRLDPKQDLGIFPESTELVAEFPGTTHPLGGQVYHWLRPAPALARERHLRYDEAQGESRPPAPRPHPMDDLDGLAMFWEKSLHPPKLVVPPPSFFRRGLPLIEASGVDFQNGGFRIALCSLADTFHPLFSLSAGGRHFQVRREEGMQDHRKLKEHLAGVIEAAAAERVHLVVFPELTVCSTARTYLAGRLRENRARWPYGVVAGSFHEWPKAASPRPWNEAWLLGEKGQNLLKHQKKKGFRISRSDVEKAPQFFPDFQPGQFDPQVSEAFEDIEDGSTLAILDTSLGRLALLICFDALAADAESGYENLVQRLRPDLLLVIAMSPKTKPFEAFFEAMSRHWVGTLFVNAQCICKESELLAGGHLALFESASAPPTRFWLKSGDREPGYQSFQQQKPPDVTGLHKHPLLGLVVDLGIHATPRPPADSDGENS